MPVSNTPPQNVTAHNSGAAGNTANVVTTPVTNTVDPTTTTTTTVTDPAATFDPAGGTASAIPTGGAPGALSTAQLLLKAKALGVDPALMMKLQDPAQLKPLVEGFMAQLMATDGQNITKKQEKQIWSTLAALSASGQLQPALTMLADEAASKGALPANIPPEKKGALVAQFAGMIEAEIAARGANGRTDTKFPSWASFSNTALKRVRQTEVPPRGPPAPSAFLDPRFVAELEKLTGARFSAGNDVTPLINGPASFAERNKLIDSATKSIHLLSWAIYDDATGEDAVARLIAAKDRGVDVKIVVDGKTAHQHGGKMLAKLEAAGIAVIRWNDPKRPHDGNHRKMMVVDGAAMIQGGMNLGDAYSHMGPPGSQKWRDTDVKVTGPAVTDGARLFAQVWNSQIEKNGLPHPALDVPAAAARAQLAPGFAPKGLAAVVNDAPGPDGDAHIYAAVLKACEGATSRIDIENAYLISTPGLVDVIKAALARGVQVRILTNSPESVDEPIVSAPIQQSLPELIAAGAEVCVKQGDTLHSKFLIVDDVFSMVTSYNFHPRSERYEEEMAVMTIDVDRSKELREQFESDMAAGKRLAKPEDVVIPKSAFSILAMRFFFDQL